MPYNFAADSFHTKILCTFFKRSAILDGNRPFCVFEPALGAEGSRTMIILGSLKARSGLPLALIELFSLGVTAQALQANIG